MKKIAHFLWIFSVFFIQNNLLGQPKLEVVPFVSGVELPVAIRHAGDDRLFIVGKHGKIYIADTNGNVNPTLFLDIDGRVRSTSNEQGLLGLAFHPQYADNGYFFVNYTFGNGDTRVSRFQVMAADSNRADPNSEKIILTVGQPYSNHNGGDLHFGPDGYLYIALGDGGSGGDPQRLAQNRQSLLGKMLRIDINQGDPYAIPSDNPYVNDNSTRDEIWALGLRNPWRFSFDRLTHDIWIGDVGQGDFEEISMQPAGSTGGENYGWRCFEGFSEFNLTSCPPAAGLTPPVHAYENTFSVGESVTGGFVYRGTQHPLLEGHYVYGDYESGRIWTLHQNAQDAWVNLPHGQLLGPKQISTFGEDVKGELYVASYSAGKVFKISEVCSALIPVVEINGDSLVSDQEGLSYQWFLDGLAIDGATSQSYAPATAGAYSVEVKFDNGCQLMSEAFAFQTTSIDLQKQQSMTIYPNPLREQTRLEFPNANGQVYTLYMYNVNGQRVLEQTGIRSESVIIQRGALPAGLYLLELRGNPSFRGKLWVRD